MDTLRFIYRYLRPHWRGYALGLLLVPFSTVAALSTPYLTGEAVSILQSLSRLEGPVRKGPGLGLILWWILALALVRGLTLFLVRYLVIGASRNVEFDLRNHLFHHLQTLDQLYFKHARTGDIMARMTSDIEAVRTVAGPVIMYTVNTALMLAMAIPLMLSLSWVLTLCIMVPLSLLTLAVRKIGPRVHDAYFKAQDTLSELSSVAQENFAGVRVVQSFAQEEPEASRFVAVLQKYFERNLDAARLSAWMHPVIGGVTDLSLISLLFAGGALILAGKLDLSDMVKFSLYQSMLLWPMIAIGWVVNQYQRGATSVKRLKQLFSVETRVKEAENPILPPSGSIGGHISIRNLSFSYVGAPVLKDVSMEIPAKHTVAIVGRVGSGKSTLVSLITRIYPVPDGAIFVDGIDVNQLSLEVLRRSVGFVPQESFLFSRTVSENIAFGVEESDPEEVYDVARITRFDKDIDQLPRGYEELVGERGVTLSGGQKQRAAIARALLMKPKILILDDALSAVDTHTEEEILENLKRVAQGLTTLIVSHRISSIQHADRIYVLDGGRVAEEGSHEELLRRGGIYAEIYRLQLLTDELEQM